MIARLTAENIHDLFHWLREHEVTYDPCRLHRDFSDCVKVAKLLQQFHPRLVEMHNYPKRNSTSLKVNNWETFNFKVLNKLGLTLNAKRIDKLVRGKPGAIEQLLWRIMRLEVENSRKRNKKLTVQEQEWTDNDDVVWTKVKRYANGSIVENTEKLILYSIYDDARRDACLLSKEIAAKEQEIAHLERLSALKAEHLVELTDRARRYDAYTNSGLDLCMSESCVPKLNLKHIHAAESSSLPGSTRTKKGNHSY